MIQSKKIIKSLVLIITDLSVKSREAISVDFFASGQPKTIQGDFVGELEMMQEIRYAPWRRAPDSGTSILRSIQYTHFLKHFSYSFVRSASDDISIRGLPCRSRSTRISS